MQYLTIAQILVSVLLIGLILIQDRSSGVSGVFGGGESGGFYQKRRGAERLIFAGTIALSVLFAAISVLSLLK
ncbi:MAG: preprotein translocase subunit SecG [Candidatus Colwellbacteria bacterium]|nr:preprotein translocase subunit SecG [Candidatus Colwellbacteria bacterium]